MSANYPRPEAFIQSLSHDGRGVTHIDGKTIFISGALPEERVQYHVTRAHKRYDEAYAEVILVPSPHRVIPTCPHFSACGGCVLQHLEPQSQLKMKELAFWTTLKKIGQVEPLLKLPPIESPPWHYRHRAKLHVQVEQDTVRIGFKDKHNARKVTDITRCPVLMDSLENLLLPLRQLTHRLEQPRHVEKVLISQGKEAISVLFCYKQPMGNSDIILLEAFGKTHACRIFIQDQAQKIHGIFPKYGLDQMTYPFTQLEMSLQFSSTDFTQVNVSTNELMLQAAQEMMKLDENDVVGDLFCGLGNFSLYLAPWVKRVIGTEMSESMILAARQNAQINHLTNLEFECFNLNEALEIGSFLKRHKPNKLLLDPPRAGALTVVETIPKSVKGLLYVSCHPATLARDAQVLVQTKGFTLKTARVIDMFPQTGHIEAMAWFERL